jgi:hypothetical protein
MVRLMGTATDLNRALASATRGVAELRKEIDTTNDRTTWLAQGILAIAPTLAPIGAVAVPAIAALATQMTVAASAAGVGALAFNGVGDALGALNDYQLEPTAANFDKLNIALEKIGPSGERFVRFLDGIGSEWSTLANIARGPLFEGVQDGLTTLTDSLLPRLRVIVREIAEGMGSLASEAGAGLAGPGFEEFFEYLRTEAQPLLIDMGHTIGNLAQGLANMMVQFGPMTTDFSNGMLEMSRSFADWSAGLDTNEGFQAFLDYIRESTPLVLEFLSALMGAMVALAKAAAPVGDILLPAFTAFLHVVEALLETPLGPMWLAAAAAASIYGRAVALAEITTGGIFGKITKGTRDNAKAAAEARLSWRDLGNTIANVGTTQKQMSDKSVLMFGDKDRINQARSSVAQYAKTIGGTTAQVAGMAVVMSDLDDKLGLTNTAMLTLIGSMGGPWGAAAGAAIGLTMDYAKRNDELVASIERVDEAMANQDLSALIEEQAKLDRELQEMAAEGNPLGGNPFGMLDKMLFGDDYEEGKRRRAEAQVEIARLQDALRRATIVEHGAGRGQGAMFRDLASDAKKAELALEGTAEAFRELRDLLADRGSLIQYERAMDDLRANLKENGQAWSAMGEAGRKNLELLADGAEGAARRVEELQRQGKNLAAQRFLNRALDELRVLRDQAGPAGRQAIQEIINKLREADNTHAKPKVTVDTGNSIPQLQMVKTAQDALDRSILITVTTNRIEKVTRQLGTPKIATGGYISGPGGPTDDLIDARLSNGEFVQKAAAVRKYGLKMMEDINNLRFANGGLVQRFANGGWTGWPGGYGPGSGSTPSGSDDDATAVMRKFFLDEFKAIIDGFEATLDMGARAVQRELQQMARQVRKDGGAWTKELREHAHELVQTTKRYHEMEARVAATTAELDQLNATFADLQAQRGSLEQSVAGQFNNPVTGQGGLGGATKTLTRDIQDIQLMDAFLEQLKGMGLDVTGERAGLYNALLNSNDVKLAGQLAAVGASAVDFLEGLFAQREALNAARAGAAGEEAFGTAMGNVATQIDNTNQRLDRQTAKLGDIETVFRDELKGLREELRSEVPVKIGDEVGEAVSSAGRSGRLRAIRNNPQFDAWGR